MNAERNDPRKHLAPSAPWLVAAMGSDSVPIDQLTDSGSWSCPGAPQ